MSLGESTDGVNSYTALAGFQVGNSDGDKDGNDAAPGETVQVGILERYEQQAKIQALVEEIMWNNMHLFIRPCRVPVEQETRIFGRRMVSLSEVLDERGTRLWLVGRRCLWRTFWNLNEPPDGTETDVYEFRNEEGLCIFQCSMHTDKMKIEMGLVELGKLVIEDYLSLNCREWDVGALIVEDRNSEQIYRFEKIKRHFDVLLYPEQFQICTVTATWDPRKFSFIDPLKGTFGTPLPDDLNFRKKALLFTSSFYIYEKYYQKDRTCRFVVTVIICVSTLTITILLILIKLKYFDVSDEDI